MNGKKGDDPILDITHWKVSRFSPTADAMIAEIVQMGGKIELERAFNLFDPPPSDNLRKPLSNFATACGKTG